MTRDFDLQVAIFETVQEMLGGIVSQQQANGAAVSPSGTVYPEAIRNILPWSVASGQIDGAASVGSNILRWPFPQGGVIRSVGIDARTVPTGGSFAITITGGETTESFSLQAGKVSNVAPSSIHVNAGAWVRVNVTATNGAADIAISLHYTTGGV